MYPDDTTTKRGDDWVSKLWIGVGIGMVIGVGVAAARRRKSDGDRGVSGSAPAIDYMEREVAEMLQEAGKLWGEGRKLLSQSKV